MEAYIYRSSLTATLLHSQGFCLYYRVTQSVSPLGYEQHTRKQKEKQHPNHHVCFWLFESSCRDFFVELLFVLYVFEAYKRKKQYCKGRKNLSRVFLDKHTKKKKNTCRDLKRLSFKTQFKIEFLLPFTGCRKVLI